ncbi:unnamed protein product [Darwinula stevensoni]|uniref:Uncharacterized protein n=1 Tax=Darwinula stevensoni TaxID=69355 RepID=A0A7R9FS28_9CRUS|nr:unnamed protein product [Darwinula stevensoni]CAG0902436.1 unnamed protein product [Darwinula stevensoni]
MLEKGAEGGRRLQPPSTDAPIHPYVTPKEAESSREDWQSILGSLSARFQDPLASLSIAFRPYVRYGTTIFDVEFAEGFQLSSGTRAIVRKTGSLDVSFPGLFRYVLSPESPEELKAKTGTHGPRLPPSGRNPSSSLLLSRLFATEGGSASVGGAEDALRSPQLFTFVPI